MGGTSCSATLRPQGATVALRRLERGVARWHADHPRPGGASRPSVARGGGAHAQRASRHRYSKCPADSHGVFHAQDRHDAIAVALDARGRASLDEMPAGLRRLPRLDVPLLPFGLVGVESLRQMGADGAGTHEHVERSDAVAESQDRGESLDALVQQIAARGKGVV